MPVPVEFVRGISTAALERQGVPNVDAAITVDALIEANLRGHDSHGVIRLPKWLEGLRHGAINARCNPVLVERGQSILVVDGDAGLGPVVADRARASAVATAKKVGIAAASVRNASHIGMLGYYVERMALSGVVGLVMTNTEPGVAPFGSMERILGTCEHLQSIQKPMKA